MLPHRSNFNLISALILLLSALVTGLYWWQMGSSATQLRTEMLNQLEFRAQQLNGAAAEEISMLFHEVDVAAQVLAKAYLPRQQAAFELKVQEVSQHLPEEAVLQVAVIDAEGFMAYSTLGLKERLFLGDREHFRAHLDSAEDKLFISKPVFGRASQKWSIQFSRPIRHNGQLAGVLVISISPTYLKNALAKLTLLSDDVIAIFRESGEYLARNIDHDNSLGKNVGPNRPFVGPVSTQAGVFKAAANYDKVTRLFHWRRLSGYPVTVVLGLSEQTALKPIESIIARDHSNAVLGTFLLWLFTIGVVVLMRKVVAQQEEVIERSALLKLMTDSAKDYAIVMIDPEGRVASWSEGAKRLQGYEDEEILGRSVKLFYTPEDLAAGKPETLLQTALRDGRCEEEGWRVRKNGSRFYADVVVAAMRDSFGVCVGFAKVTRDITERKQFNDNLMAAKAAAEAANLAKSQFVANMSHEIRTPMNAVLGLLQLLQHTPLTSRQLDYVQKTQAAASSLLGILNDILDFSKVEAGRLELEHVPFRFDKLLRNLSVLLSAAVQSKVVEVLFDLDPRIPHAVRGDELRLHQILLNLTGNAVKFTERGEVLIRLRVVDIQPDLARIEFSVKDTGIGIPAEKQGAIFEGFSQAEASTSRRYGGTGLGLAITQRLVGLMGGELKVDSVPGQGSNFHFVLDFPRDSETLALERDANSARNPANLAHRMRVLVVDDNAVARDVLSGMVTNLGWSVETVDNGAAALDCLQRNQIQGTGFDVIFVDWVMPGMDGWETVQHIRANYPDETAPVLIMVTAHGRELLAERLAEGTNPLDGFLVKPVTPSMLFDAVADATSGDSVARDTLQSIPANRKRLAGLRLLVVEDNLMNQQVAQELLSFEGAYVEVAGDGRQGVARVAGVSQPFDAVLMDIQMPDIDGFEATRILREDMGLSNLPIIAMTANAMPADYVNCLAAGMNDHIGKPIDINLLIEVILRHCTPREVPAIPFQPIVHEAAAAQATDVLPEGFGLDAALNRLGGNRVLFAELARHFRHDQGHVLADLELALQQGDRELARRLLHTLKGVAGAVGAEALANHASEMGGRIKAGTDAAENSVLLSRLGQLMDQAIAALERIAEKFVPSTPRMMKALDDPGEVLELLAALMVLLEENNMRSLDVYASLKSQFGDALGEHLVALDEAMGELNFATAYEKSMSLRVLLASSKAVA